jgi:DNA replication protein DnaC
MVMKNGLIYLGKDKHYYSVPCRYIGRKVNLQVTRDRMEVFYKYERIAVRERHNRSIERSTKNARFRYKSTIEQLCYEVGRGLDKNQIHLLADGGYIRENETILITGPTGTGKSFLSSALGHQACQQGFKVFYANTTRLFAQLKMAKADGSGIRELAKIENRTCSSWMILASSPSINQVVQPSWRSSKTGMGKDLRSLPHSYQ